VRSVQVRPRSRRYPFGAPHECNGWVIADMNERAEVLSSGTHVGRLRLGAIVVALAVASIAGWLLLGGDKNERSAPGPAAPVAASPAQLHALSGKLRHDVFWAGSRSGVTYELTQPARGKVFIRY